VRWREEDRGSLGEWKEEEEKAKEKEEERGCDEERRFDWSRSSFFWINPDTFDTVRLLPALSLSATEMLPA
jgi:hypothetical protein